MENGGMKKRTVWALLFITLLGLAVYFWPAAPMEPLDKFRKGDIMAKAGDIKISKKTPLYVMYKYHPSVAEAEKNVYAFNKNVNHKYEIERYVRSAANDANNKDLLVHHITSFSEFPKDKESFLLTYAVDVNSFGRPYNFRVTIRQGNYFWYKSVERGIGNEGSEKGTFHRPFYYNYYLSKYVWYFGNRRRFTWLFYDEYHFINDIKKNLKYLNYGEIDD